MKAWFFYAFPKIILKPLVLLATLSFAMLGSAADWIFDGSVMSNGVWSFNATMSGNNITVGTPIAADCPTAVTSLDFSQPVKSADGETTYTITVLNCKFRDAAAVKSYLGELTLPGEGLTTIEGSCFGQCPNLTGELVFPSTLTRLKGAAFYYSSKITANAATIPEGLVEMGVQVFTGTGLYGDMRLPNLVTDDMRDTFLGTKITSVYLGPGVTGLWGANEQGPFQNCTELTNVTFDAGCSVYFKAQSVFAGCTKLKELDLSCATTFEANNNGHFYGCTSLKKITFGPKLVALGYKTFRDTSALEEIVFTGPPPTTFGLPYLKDAADKRTINTTVYKANYQTKNASGLSWLDYAENGEIHPTGSTFASTNVSVSASLRPLTAPDIVISGDASVSKSENDWQVSVTVTLGEGELYVTATDPDGGVVTNLISATAAPSPTPYVAVLSGLSAGRSYSLALLSNVDGLWESAAPFATIFNGNINITKLLDADRGEGITGKFKISLANDAVASSDIVVACEVGDSTTAACGADFCEPSGTVTIRAGESSAFVQIAPLPSGVVEDRIVEIELEEGNYFIGSASDTLAIKGSETFGGWVFDTAALTMSNATWQFVATLNGVNGIDVGSVNGDTSKGPVPTELSPLDLSKTVVGTDNKAYTIVKLGTLFGDSVSALRPLVGALTMPGEGLVEIGAHAFNSCTKATGDIVFPSTLTTIGGAAFMSDTGLNIDASKIPSGITSLGVQVFLSTGLYGDLYLPNLVGDDFRATFESTKLTSICMGPGVTGINGGYDQGFIQRCTKLTNVVLQADSVYMGYCFIFRDCTSLKELDLSMVSKLENQTEDGSSYCGGFFDNSGIERITFGPKVQKVSSRSFQNANKLKEIIFEGPPPVSLPEPYMYGVSQSVTTYVHRDQIAVTNSAGKCWNDYVEDGKVKYRNTTFASDHVSVDPSLRPLLMIEPDPGFMIILR